MRKFLVKTFIYVSLSFGLYAIIIECLFYFATSDSVFSIFKQDWIRISQRIEDSKGEIRNDTLIVGCSVSAQLFPYNRSNQLTTNGSTYAIGNYFLIRNAITENRNISTVIYLSTPDVIGHKLSRERTYNYFVKPFYTFENRNVIVNCEPVYNTLKSNPTLPLCLFNSFKLLPIDDYNYANQDYKRPDSLALESIEWLNNIKSLCEGYNVQFFLASPPVAKSRLVETNDWRIIRNQVEHTTLEDLFDCYFNTVIYIDDEFLRDEIHWKHDFINDNRSELIKEILNRLND